MMLKNLKNGPINIQVNKIEKIEKEKFNNFVIFN